MLQASKSATLNDFKQIESRLAHTRNTQPMMSTMLDVQDISSQQAYDLESGLTRLHQKVLQTTGAELDVYFQSQQVLKHSQTSSVDASKNVAPID